MKDGGRETRVRVKCGHFAGREGVLVDPQPGDAPGKLRVRFDKGIAGFFKYDDVEFLPPLRLEPDSARDIPAVLAGIGRWQQQDPMSRRAHFVGEPVVAGNIRGHVVTVHVVTAPEPDRHGFDTRSITITAPATEAEVVAALDRLLAQPPGTRASLTTDDAEALATHAGGAD